MDFVSQERNAPLEKVQVTGEMERLFDVLVLFDVHLFVLNENDRAFVVVLAAVVWRGEDRYNGGEGLLAAPPVHLVAVVLNLMRSYYG